MSLDLLRIRAAAFGVDVGAVRLVVRDRQFGAEFAQNARRRFVSRAVRDIDRDAHFLERHPARKTRLGKFHVTAERVVDAAGAADLPRGRSNRIDLAGENELLDLLLDFVVEFVAIVPEKFDAVVLVGIVRGGKNDAGIGAQRARDVGHARRRQRTDQQAHPRLTR